MSSAPIASTPEPASPTEFARPTELAQPPAPRGVTSDEALREIIRSLMSDSAADLRAGFEGVPAREGALQGAHIGLLDSRVVATADWTSRLGPSVRTLHAVVRDPREPFEWWDQQPPGIPRAAVLAALRDFDIVLVVAPVDGAPRAWRFSLADGIVIDIVIDSGEGPSLVRRLGYLTPSPDDEPGSFLVLPPHEMRPAPAGIGFGTGNAPPAPVQSPSLAPDGRTGDPILDAHIDRLLSADASMLANAYPNLPAAQESCDESCDWIRVSPAAWTSRLAAGKRSLYAVFTGDPADAEVILALDAGGSAAEAWQFRVLRGRLAEVAIHIPQPLPSSARVPFLFVASGHSPSPAREYERFYVLPPQGELPKPPRAHALSTRTGETGVDGLLATLQARNAIGLLAAFADPATPLVRECQGLESKKDAAYAASWSQETARQIYGMHAVARLPDGYQPRADHLLIAVRQLKPYWWEPMGILERQGRIVGLITSDSGCFVEGLYPAARYLVPPPDGGLTGLDPARRSGIPSVDALLDAARAGDEVAMAGLIVYTPVACGDSVVPHGPPGCPPGAAPGTPVDVFPEIVCAGNYYSRERAPAALIAMMKSGGAPLALYAVTEARSAPDPGAPGSIVGVVLASRDGGALVLGVTEHGVTSAYAGCGPLHPEALIGSAQPSFLLPPP